MTFKIIYKYLISFSLLIYPLNIAIGSDVVEKTLVNEKHLSPGLIFLHIPKAGGSSITYTLAQSLKKNYKPPSEITKTDLKVAIDNDFLTTGHISLKDLVAYNVKKKMVFTFLRHPVKRAISHMRYYKQQALDGSLGLEDWDINLNSLSEILSLGDQDHIYSTMLRMLAPDGLDLTSKNMSEETIDKIVIHVMENINFIGNIDDYENDLNRLSIATGIKLDISKTKNSRVNPTTDNIEKITNPDVIEYITQESKWELMLYSKLLTLKRWRFTIPEFQPLVKGEPGIIKQIVMPAGFDPDIYLYVNPETERQAMKLHKDDLWERRKWALNHYISVGKNEGLNFQYPVLLSSKIQLFWSKFTLYFKSFYTTIVDENSFFVPLN